jgi:hypothetical protein
MQLGPGPAQRAAHTPHQALAHFVPPANAADRLAQELLVDSIIESAIRMPDAEAVVGMVAEPAV